MKSETIEEFLARGGQIKKIPPGESVSTVKAATVNSTNAGGPAVLLTYGEADLFHGEARTRKTKKVKAEPKIDFSALPEALRNKLAKKMANDE